MDQITRGNLSATIGQEAGTVQLVHAGIDKGLAGTAIAPVLKALSIAPRRPASMQPTVTKEGIAMQP